MKPFPARKRNTILVFGTILFICLIPFLILSAMGFKIDLHPEDGGTGTNKGFFASLVSFEKTGGIYVRSDLFGTVVYIDDKEFTDRGILSRNIFAQDLVPGTYEVKIQKEGYRDWVRNVIVSPNKVTETYLFTLPTELVFTEVPQYLDSNGMPTTTAPLAKPLNSSSRSTSTNKLITTNPEYTEVLQLFTGFTVSSSTPKVLSSIRSTGKNAAAKITTGTNGATGTTSSTTANASDVANLEINKVELYGEEISRNLYATSTGSTLKFTWDGGYDQTPYYFCKFEICEDTVELVLPETIKKFYLFPGRDDIVIVELASGIYYADMTGMAAERTEVLYKKPKASVFVREGEVFVKDGTKLLLMTY